MSSLSCQEYIEQGIGLALGNLMLHARLLPSEIGKVKHSNISGETLKVIGVEYDDTYNPAYMLSEPSTQITNRIKFRGFMGKTPVDLLRGYLDISKQADKKDGKELIDTLQKYCDNKLELVPVKTKDTIVIKLKKEEGEGEGVKIWEEVKKVIVDKIQWKLDERTNQIYCWIVSNKLSNITQDRVRYKLNEYNTGFYLSGLEFNTEKSVIRRDLIQMATDCYIKPIQIIDREGRGVVLDNSMLYYICGEEIIPIGYWDRHGKINSIKRENELFMKVCKEDTYKILAKYIKYISRHRNYIGPAFISEMNTVEV